MSKEHYWLVSYVFKDAKGTGYSSKTVSTTEKYFNNESFLTAIRLIDKETWAITGVSYLGEMSEEEWWEGTE